MYMCYFYEKIIVDSKNISKSDQNLIFKKSVKQLTLPSPLLSSPNCHQIFNQHKKALQISYVTRLTLRNIYLRMEIIFQV